MFSELKEKLRDRLDQFLFCHLSDELIEKIKQKVDYADKLKKLARERKLKTITVLDTDGGFITYDCKIREETL